MSRKTARRIGMLLVGSALWGSGFTIVWNLVDPVAALLLGGLLLAVAMFFIVPWAIGSTLVQRQDRRQIAARNRVRAQLDQTPAPQSTGTAGTSSTRRRAGPTSHRTPSTTSGGRHRTAA